MQVFDSVANLDKLLYRHDQVSRAVAKLNSKSSVLQDLLLPSVIDQINTLNLPVPAMIQDDTERKRQICF